MEAAEPSSLRSRRQTAARSVVIVGGTERAATFIRLLNGAPGVCLLCVCANASDRAGRYARAARVPLVDSPIEALEFSPPPDIVIDLSEDVAIRAELESALPPHAELLSGNSADLIWGIVHGRMEELETPEVRAPEAEEELRRGLEEALGRVRRLEAAVQSAARTTRDLEARLAEVYFMHEFVKALVAYNRVEDVASVVVDASAGILGADIAAVYLADQGAQVWILAGGHGRLPECYSTRVDLSDALIAAALQAGTTASPAVVNARPAAWTTEREMLGTQVAVALSVGGEPVGVLVLGWVDDRRLGSDELDRLGVIADQSALSLQNALLHVELERLAVTDRLTELFNHGYLRQRLDQEIGRARRFGHTLSVIMLDIDDFKALNDRYGHLVGDEVLKSVSRVIRESLREMDVAARYGGEEFLLIVPETDSAGAVALAERVRRSVESCPLSVAGGKDDVRATVSLGVATYPTDGDTVDGLVRSADEAMYCAKHSGKNRVAAWGDA